MDKKMAGLLGAAAALTTLGSAQAAPAPQAPLAAAISYKDLLEPIPNAMAALRDDATRSQAGSGAKMERVQYYHHHHHHHHHHHGYGPGIVGGIIGGVIGGALAPAPPCYWTYGRPYWDGYRWVRPRIQVCR
jgi:hypothetical protein